MGGIYQRLDGYRTIALVFLVMLPFAAQAAPPLFARFSADRPRPYVGEAFQLTLRLYVTGGNLDKQISMSGLPAATDLQLKGFEELPIGTEVIDGNSYEVRPFRTWARAPHPGTVILAPRLGSTWIQTTRSFFFMQESRRPAEIIAESFNLSIRPLPAAGRPQAFSGLAGRFRFTATAAPLDVAVGDLITLTLAIEGDWLPDLFEMPTLHSTPLLKVYDARPVVEECTPLRRISQQTVVPQEGGEAILPPLKLEIFDTGSETYRTLSAGPFPITFHAEHAVKQAIYTPPMRSQNHAIAAPSSRASPAPAASPWQRFWTMLSGRHEATVGGKSAASVRLAPAESSEELFTLEPGTVLVIVDRQGDWIRISVPKGIGWIQAAQTGPAP